MPISGNPEIGGAIGGPIFPSPKPARRQREARMRSIIGNGDVSNNDVAPDFPHFATTSISIRSKSGAICPLVFNRAQRHIHARLEEQLQSTGRVRALILKGRQQGCSTYVGARFFHRAMHVKGLRVFILTHEDAATQNLFDIVQRFQANCGDDIRRATKVANAHGLTFAEIDSGYMLGTAGTKGVGRSSTIQLFHGSEVAFWPHADTHAAGVLQAVPDAEGTEIILESTANGPGNFFHRTWRDAESGRNDYVPIFVPWYWQEEYRKPGAGFEPSEEERAYGELYGLDDGQLAWRRAKIAELRDAALFRQEYPACAAEAFEMSGHDSFIPPALVAAARKATCEASGPLVIGFDPAWTGGDRHAMAWRQGRRLIKIETRQKLDTMQAAGWVKQVIDKDKPRRVFIDVGGVGAGVCDRLKEMGYGDTVRPINFGSAPFDPPPRDEQGRASGGPLNRRAEMWMKSKEWLADPAGVQIPDSDSLQADACGPGYSYDSTTRLMLEKKEDMRRRGAPSPDEWDAVALTFAEPVGEARLRGFDRKIEYPPLGWM
jgi:hypothetical protein